MLLLVVSLPMEGHLFGLTPHLDLNDQPGYAVDVYVHFDNFLGGPVGRSGAGHEKGEGWTPVDGLQEALCSAGAPQPSPASSYHHRSAGMRGRWFGACSRQQLAQSHPPRVPQIDPCSMTLVVVVPVVVAPELGTCATMPKGDDYSPYCEVLPYLWVPCRVSVPCLASLTWRCGSPASLAEVSHVVMGLMPLLFQYWPEAAPCVPHIFPCYFIF